MYSIFSVFSLCFSFLLREGKWAQLGDLRNYAIICHFCHFEIVCNFLYINKIVKIVLKKVVFLIYPLGWYLAW